MSASPQPIREWNRNRAQEEAQRMESVGRLVSGVAHDFNNLLTGIVLCADLMLAGLKKQEGLRRYAEEIRNAAGQGARLIQQLLALAGQRTSGPQLVSINDAIGDLHPLLRRLIGENIELAVAPAEDLKRVRIDPAELQQIILNLVLNARDAMPDGGRITLGTRNGGAIETGRQQVRAELIVQDTGCGMDEATRLHALEAFFTTKPAGNGLGLATVHSIVKRAGGTVEIDSRPGEGTRVRVRLPIAQAEDEVAREIESLINI